MTPCSCQRTAHGTRLVAITGGPGAGKTAVLEVVRRDFCEHVAVLPEAASVLFTGGFPRRATDPARRSAQRAIFHGQVEMERMLLADQRAAVVLCDRGTLDALAYWTGTPDELWADVGSSEARELARYAAVIHLRTPAAGQGYDHANPVRIETAEEASAIDQRILTAWAQHPHRTIVENRVAFLGKLEATIEAIRREVPACCRGHRIDPVPTSSG